MSYATTAEIEGEFLDTTFGVSSPITSTEIDRFCEEISRWIDLSLATRYVTPVIEGDSPEAFKTVRFITILLVSSRVRRIMNADGGNPSEDALNLADKNEKKALRILENLKDGVIILPDAETSAPLDVSSFNDTNAIEPLFERDGDQW